jgi:hypothetical protein
MNELMKIHVNEPMRSHLEFVLRRYSSELGDWLRRPNLANRTAYVEEQALNDRCLREVMQAGT